MTTLEAGLYSRLTGDTDVSALVSTRVYPHVAPQGASLPYLTYYRVTTNRAPVMSGAVDLINPRIQVDVWASTYTGARDLADKVRHALDQWTGSAGGVSFRWVSLVDERDSIEPAQDASEEPTYRVSLDIETWHRETAAYN